MWWHLPYLHQITVTNEIMHSLKTKWWKVLKNKTLTQTWVSGTFEESHIHYHKYFFFFLPSATLWFRVKQCKGSCLFVPTLALYLQLTPIVDTSKLTPYLCCTEAALPSILNPESWVRELTVVLSHPSILVVLWRENNSTAVEFPSPVSSEAGSVGSLDQTGPQWDAESCVQRRRGPCIKDSPWGYAS